jgi:RNA polymerase subunit RPABC4/transcription elongation factor Spt4
MMLETVKCGYCGSTKIPIGADECPFCGSTFKERWEGVRKSNPAESSEALALAMHDAEGIYAELSAIHDRTNGRSKMLRPKEMRVFVASRCKGTTDYCKFVLDHVINMWQATREAVAIGERTFSQTIWKRRFF